MQTFLFVENVPGWLQGVLSLPKGKFNLRFDCLRKQTNKTLQLCFSAMYFDTQQINSSTATAKPLGADRFFRKVVFSILLYKLTWMVCGV